SMTSDNPRIRIAAIGVIACGLLALGETTRAETIVQTPASLPPPDAVANVIDKQLDYHIGPLDTLEISVFQVDYLDHPIQVGADGHVGLPLIGDVAAAGKTPRELADAIAHKLGERYLQ